jgi:cellulose biosynthesis protein BcsQ
MNMEATRTPGVIVVAEPVLSELLTQSRLPWLVQERQASVAAMWAGLSNGELSAQSRILIFSDSLMVGTASAEDEREQTARAIVAMASAGAHVFVAVWNSLDVDELTRRIDAAAAAQGLQPGALTIHFLPVEKGGRAVLECMRIVLAEVVDFPEVYPVEVDRVLSREQDETASRAPTVHQQVPAQSPPVAPAPPAAPALPALGIGLPSSVDAQGSFSGASQELLARPALPGQVTITVTSSKGGSGKSTASLLLAASIARASREAGRPLSVCLVDMDTRDGQIASLIGKYMPTALNIRVQPVWDELTIRRHLVHEDALGIDALLAPIRPRTADTVGPDFYRTIIRSLQRMYDVVVMDTSVQYLDPLIANVCLPEATEVLFITTLASTAVQGMARALREITAPVDESGLGIPREKIGIIVNQSVAGVGMQREQILAAGLGVPVVGVIPLATKDVLTATNLHRMHTLLDHPLIGTAYNELARTCLPDRGLGPFNPPPQVVPAELVGTTAFELPITVDAAGSVEPRKKGMFRRA